MKKLFLSVILCLTILLSLVACTKEGSVTLGDYDKIEVSQSDVTVTDDDIQTEINSILSKAATTATVTEGTVAQGDSITISYVGYIDGATFDGGSAENTPITLGSSGYIDGFDAGLYGATIGSTVSLNLTFPDPYETNTDLSGKAVTFDVTINSKQVTTTPDLTDEWVAQNYSAQSLTTVDAFKSYVATYLGDNKLKTAAWNVIVEKCTVENYNEDELSSEVAEAKSYYESQASNYGMELADYLKLTGSSEENITSEVKNYLKEQMVLNKIAEKEGITIDEEYESVLQSYVDNGSYDSIDALKEKAGESKLKNLKLALLFNKVMDVLVDNTTVVPDSEETTTAVEETTVAE